MLRELQAGGYLRRERIKRLDGTFAWETTIYEVPALASPDD